MPGSMVELISVLNDNEQILTELASALTEEQSCIIDLDLERLARNGGRKEALMARLARVREECGALMRQAGAELGLAETPSLSPLIAAAASAEQSRLLPLQQRLMQLARTLERQHDMNRRMLENSIGMINGSMAMFSRLLGGCDTYGARGHINNGMTSGSFLRQEI